MSIREVIEPQQKKVQAIILLNPPSNVKELRHFLGMVQYYCDMRANCRLRRKKTPEGQKKTFAL
jgi:hypothetical protein